LDTSATGPVRGSDMPIFKGPDALPLAPDLDEEQAARTTA